MWQAPDQQVEASVQTQSRNIIPVTCLSQQLTGRVTRLLPVAHVLIHLHIWSSSGVAGPSQTHSPSWLQHSRQKPKSLHS